MSNLSIQDLMDSLPEFFLPENASGLSAVVQFEISGEQGGVWVVKIADATCQVAKGKAESADLIFQADALDVLDIFNNRLDPMRAYLQGKLRLTGHFPLALQLFNLFKLESEKLDRLRNK